MSCERAIGGSLRGILLAESEPTELMPPCPHTPSQSPLPDTPLPFPGQMMPHSGAGLPAGIGEAWMERPENPLSRQDPTHLRTALPPLPPLTPTSPRGSLAPARLDSTSPEEPTASPHSPLLLIIFLPKKPSSHLSKPSSDPPLCKVLLAHPARQCPLQALPTSLSTQCTRWVCPSRPDCAQTPPPSPPCPTRAWECSGSSGSICK